MPRIIAIDWSGAANGASRRIWLAEVDAATGSVVRLENGRSRDEVAEHLLDERRRTPRMIVGLDFAFSLPSWFLEREGLPEAPALWELATRESEMWLRKCDPPFWGRPGTRRPELPEHFRQTDLDVPAVSGIRPKSVFQIGGAGAVGTGSLRGMPVLHRLRKSGYAVWPFDASGPSTLVEIYPRLLTGPVNKTCAASRRAFLLAKYPALSPAIMDAATSSDDAFDAVVSALVMAKHENQLSSLAATTSARRRREGQIWWPSEEAKAEVQEDS